jgi:hypothetical protein
MHANHSVLKTSFFNSNKKEALIQKLHSPRTSAEVVAATDSTRTAAAVAAVDVKRMIEMMETNSGDQSEIRPRMEERSAEDM